MIDPQRDSLNRCNDDQLRELLRDETADHHSERLLGHVESCERCQRRLDELVADQAEWIKATDILSAKASETGRAYTNGTSASFRLSDVDFRQPAWTETMAKSLLSPPSHPEMLGRIGRYDVERLIGSGGMGVVFKAYDTELNRYVAVKLLAPYLASSGSARKRFAREARAAAGVVDDHVVPIHNVESENDPPFLVMQYIAGGSLQEKLDRDGPLDVTEILRIGMQTAKGLAAAHAQGLIHRDVKPSNILLDEGVERALLTDFGLARAEDDACLTRSGFQPGTPHYMSPEQVRGETIDGRSDLFSLGCVLYALCTGHPPFRAPTSYAVMRRITDKAARPICEVNTNIPQWLEGIVMKLLAKPQEERFGSADKVADLLGACLAHLRHPTTTPLPHTAARLLPTRKSLPPYVQRFVASAVVITLLGAAVLFVLKTNQGAPTIPSKAEAVASSPLTEQRELSAAVFEFNNLHSKDGQGRPQQRVTTAEVIANLMWRMGNGELSGDIMTAIQPMLYTRERLLPAGWQLTGGLVRRRCESGIIQTWEVNLETGGLAQPISIRRTAIGPPSSLRTPSKTINEEVASAPLANAIDEFNALNKKNEQFKQLTHRARSHGLELPPLTIEEVLAAIAFWQTQRDEADVDDATFQRLQRIAVTHQLPSDIRFEWFPSIDNGLGQWFTIGAIRILVPRAGESESMHAFTLRQHFIDQDGDNPAATHWGKPGSNGIQAGFRLIPSRRIYQHDQVVDIEFLFRSISGKEIPATLPGTFRYRRLRAQLRRIDVQGPNVGKDVGTTIDNHPTVVRAKSLQFCLDADVDIKDGVGTKIIVEPGKYSSLQFVVSNPGDDSEGEELETGGSHYFNTPSLEPKKVLPLYAGHWYQHWGRSIPGQGTPAESAPDPEYIDPFQIGVSLGPAEKSRIPAYYASGLQVAKVAPHSPAEAVGIEVGDILLSWEGNQIYGDDPEKPFLKYNRPNHHLREAMERNEKSRGWGSYNMKFDLLDHRSGEVIRIAPWFGFTAGGSPIKSELIKRLQERKRVRSEDVR